MRNRYVSTIYLGLANKKSIKDIHKEIRNITHSQIYHNLPVSTKLEKQAFAITKKASKQVYGVTLTEVAIADTIYQVLNRMKTYQETNTTIYNDVKGIENTLKISIIDQGLKENERLAREMKDQFNAKVFYLASTHEDSATDHKDYQGKIYIDKNWKSVITNKEVAKEIQKYINIHNTKTFQWVIGKPVWFVTRPNCRHYFKALPVKEVIEKKVETLIRNHKMHNQVGMEITRTIKHSTRKPWYTTENIENIIKQYQDRLSYHLELYRVKKSPIIKRAIDKDRLLIKKWSDYLQSVK